MWEPARDFAWLKLPSSGARCIVALNGNLPQVMVISSEGYFYAYNIDLENGGECLLMKQYRSALSPSCTKKPPLTRISLLDSDEAAPLTA